MYRYEPNNQQQNCGQRPVSSLSSGSSDSGVWALPSSTPQSQTSEPSSRAVSGPPSPSLQINELMQQTASLMAVNAALRKQIESARAAGLMPGVEDVERTIEEFRKAQEAAIPETQPFQGNNALRPPLPGKKQPRPESYKTVMCQAWLESRTCAFAENCRFAHGEHELRPICMQPRQNNKYKTKLCDKYTTTGLCPYGGRCLFIHPDNGNNSYIRPDKLLEVTQRHANATTTGVDAVVSRPATPPIGALPPTSNFGGPTPLSRRPGGLRPHPSWPLEPPTFFNDHKQQIDMGMTDMTPAGRTSIVSAGSGYYSGGSSPLDEALTTDNSPFSGIGDNSPYVGAGQEEVEHKLKVEKEEEDSFKEFSFDALDNIAEELTKNLELW